jgi:hypothetical protein
MHDVLATGLIILIIGLAVAPFFLLSSAFGAPKRVKKEKDRNDGPVIPVSPDTGAPFPHTRKQDADSDGDGGSEGGGDGGGGSD